MILNNIQCTDLDEILKILSCSTRRKILVLTKDAPQTIRELSEQLGMTMNPIQRHIKILLNAKIITLKKRGNIPLYYLNRCNVKQLKYLLEQYWSLIFNEQQASKLL